MPFTLPYPCLHGSSIWVMWKVMEDGKRLEYGMALGSEIIPS